MGCWPIEGVCSKLWWQTEPTPPPTPTPTQESSVLPSVEVRVWDNWFWGASSKLFLLLASLGFGTNDRAIGKLVTVTVMNTHQTPITAHSSHLQKAQASRGRASEMDPTRRLLLACPFC